MAAFLRPQEFERIAFRSLPGSFRGRLSQSQQFTSLWLEDRETKRQWSLDIVDVNEYAPNGVTLPSSTVVNMLKQALEAASSGKEVELGPDSPVIDTEVGDHLGMALILKCYFYQSFAPEFKFPLNPVEVDPMVSLASQLRDAREEIKAAERKISSTEGEIAELKAEIVKLKENRSKASSHFPQKITPAPTMRSAGMATALRLQQEKNHREKLLDDAKWRLDHGEAPTEEAVREWNRTEKKRALAAEASQRREEELLLGPARGVDGGVTKTAAEPRPTAYIPDELGIPKPYGNLAPFKPSELGSSMRHIRPPQPKPIEI